MLMVQRELAIAGRCSGWKWALELRAVSEQKTVGKSSRTQKSALHQIFTALLGMINGRLERVQTADTCAAV